MDVPLILGTHKKNQVAFEGWSFRRPRWFLTMSDDLIKPDLL